MEAMQERLGCDHRAVFDTTYLELTRTARDALLADPDLLRFKRFFFREDALFANVYFRTIRMHERGEPVPAAWQIAFDAAASDDVTGVQDMLLGINAHVQNDMPFVLAQLGLRDRDGNSRKVDHDKFNAVLSEGYERVVTSVRDRYDPLIGVSNPDFLPADDVAGLELVRQWRENVWRNAERLVNAKTEEERAEVAPRSRSTRRGGRSRSRRPRCRATAPRATRTASSSSGSRQALFRPTRMRTCVRDQITTRI